MNPAALVLFVMAAAGLVAGAGFGITVGEETGAALLMFSGLAAGVAGLAVVLTQGRDVALPAEGREAASLPASPSAVWPLAAGLSALVIAAGMATNSGIVWMGVAAAIATAAGWFAQSWSQHPTWTDEQNERVTFRLVMPLALPVGVTALVAILAIAFSRALLAASVNGSVLLALVAATVILGAGSLVALKGLGRSAVLGLLTAGALATAALGVGGAVAGEREFHQAGEGGHASEEGGHGEAEDGHSGEEKDDPSEPAAHGEEEAHSDENPPPEGTPEASEPRVQKISSDKLAFDIDKMRLPADQPTSIEFTNREAAPHNVAIKSSDGELVWRPDGGGIITGPGKTVEYDVTPLEEGEYIFFCEVHPAQMQGELTVA